MEDGLAATLKAAVKAGRIIQRMRTREETNKRECAFRSRGGMAERPESVQGSAR